ncbi:MAG: type VI secretion system tube protein Hcp [Myxococcales bacterium]
MAVDMFIKIDDIKGESVDSKHAGEIQVLSWNWGMTQSGTTHNGPGGGAGQVNVQDLTFTKYVDSSTPNLIKFCCSGKHFAQAVLTVRKAGDKPLEYMKLTLTELIVSSLSTGGGGGQERLTESVSLNFSKFTIDYTPQKADGSGGAAISANWDIAGNMSK